MTSSVKPEVHNVSQRRSRRTEPRPQEICTKIREDRFSDSSDMLADRQTHQHTQTHTQTDKLIAILRCFTGAKQNDCSLYKWQRRNVGLVGNTA